MKRSSTSTFSKIVVGGILGAVLPGSAALAASCCGGSFTAPAIINGDDRAQLAASYSYTSVAVESVDADGVWYTSGRGQNTQTMKFEGARLIGDRWQTGFSLPVISRSAATQGSSTGLGDVALALAYEILPDWDYNPYRPKGIAFLTLTLPTGKSRAESELGGVDSRGAGFWAAGAGLNLSKVFGHWDSLVSLEAHRSFEKAIATSQMQGRLQPGYGGSFTLGGGYGFAGAWRAGASLTWAYEDPVALANAENTSIVGGIERSATAALSLAHFDQDQWTETIAYSDQTIFGAPVNTSLGRGIQLQLQRRWGR